MIKVEHIKAHLPSKNCQLSFMLRRKPKALAVAVNEVDLTEDFIDIDINCVIQVGQFANLKEIVELCAIAVTETDKICVGSIDVDLSASIHSDKANLKGVTNQDGYIIYSYLIEGQNEKIPSAKSLDAAENANQSKNTIDKKNSPERGFIKYKNTSSNSSLNENNESQQSIQSNSRSSSPFKKNKLPQQVQVESSPGQFHKLLDEVYHEVLKEQLYNQRAWNKIQENEIFQLRYKQRIQALLANSLTNSLNL